MPYFNYKDVSSWGLGTGYWPWYRSTAVSTVIPNAKVYPYPQWTRGHTVLHHRFAILRRYCHLAYPSTPRSSALQNHKSEMQNSFGPQPPNFGGWQGNGWRRTGCTPTDVNAASRQKTVVEACVPLFTEGISTRGILRNTCSDFWCSLFWLILHIISVLEYPLFRFGTPF